jgi:two-component system response regulator HydG
VLPIISTEVKILLQYFSEPAILLSTNYEILAANDAYKRLYGQDILLKHSHCYEISHQYDKPCDQSGETCPLKQTLISKKPQRVLHLHHTPHGETHVEVETLPIYNDDNEIIYLLEIMRCTKVAIPNAKTKCLLGNSAAFRKILDLITRVAPSNATVLLLGESGTGKEVVAQAIHGTSARAKEVFIPVECSGLSENLFESELFGHEKGAFTGAYNSKQGLVEAAKGGTLFLDEIGDIPLSLQVKLLRLLETGIYRRVGSVEPQEANFRVICATHRDLKQMVKQGEFRQDLYYRISTFPIELPPLRERREDLALLIENQLQAIAPKRKLSIHKKTLSILLSYEFPGNIRELRNILERGCLLADQNVILPEHLPDECNKIPKKLDNSAVSPVIKPLETVEQEYLQWAIKTFDGDKAELAYKLGISERTLYRKLQKLS